jgi:hypothetical protein
MINCPVCAAHLKISALDCPGCGVHVSGEFSLPRLARLSPENRKLAEQLLLSGGNLKKMGEDMGISHPTLRKKVDEMIAELQTLRRDDEKRVGDILGKIERGEMKPEEGLRHIKEVNGEL